MTDRFCIDEFMRPVDMTPPGTIERQAALEAAHRELETRWAHLPPALAQRAAVLIEQRTEITYTETTSLS